MPTLQIGEHLPGVASRLLPFAEAIRQIRSKRLAKSHGAKSHRHNPIPIAHPLASFVPGLTLLMVFARHNDTISRVWPLRSWTCAGMGVILCHIAGSPPLSTRPIRVRDHGVRTDCFIAPYRAVLLSVSRCCPGLLTIWSLSYGRFTVWACASEPANWTWRAYDVDHRSTQLVQAASSDHPFRAKRFLRSLRLTYRNAKIEMNCSNVWGDSSQRCVCGGQCRSLIVTVGLAIHCRESAS